MIPLPGLVVLIWMARVLVAVFVVTLAASVVGAVRAHISWRSRKPATAAERILWIVLVPGLLCIVLLFPPFNARVLIASLVPAFISASTIYYVRRGNRVRGLLSLGIRATVSVALASLAGCAVLFFGTLAVVHAHQARERRMEEAARAAGRANQDDFAALAVTDSGFVVAGETSTPPARGDDAWLLSLDRSLTPARRYAPIAPADQVLLAVAVDPRGVTAGGRDEERPVWVRLDGSGDVTARRTWPWHGAVHAIAALPDGSTLVVGGRNNAPFVARVNQDGTERWSAFPGVRGTLRAVVTNGRAYLAVGNDDVPDVPDSSMVLAGGTTDGARSWARGFRASRFLPEPQGMAMARDGVALVFGTTSEVQERMADLWLARITMDGTLLEEHTYGGPFAESAGGIAARDRRVFVAGFHFVPLRHELWLSELDERGHLIWERTYPAPSHGRPIALAATREGNLVVAGYREGEDGHRDGWIARFDSTGSLIAQRTYP